MVMVCTKEIWSGLLSCLCGKRDRAILLEKEKMTFSDLDRLTYVSDFLGLKLYNLEI